MRIEFDKENTWKEYKEVALLPTFILYAENDPGYRYHGLIFHFLVWKVAFTLRTP